jgi:hypothetical protein
MQRQLQGHERGLCAGNAQRGDHTDTVLLKTMSYNAAAAAGP